MRVQVVLSICTIFLQNTYETTIQAQTTDEQEGPNENVNTNPETRLLDLDYSILDFRTSRKGLISAKLDMNAVINALAHNTRAQRLKVAEEYKLLYKSELTDYLKQKVSGSMKKLVIDLMMPLNDYYAKELYEAMYGTGTDEGALIEILCTKDNQEINDIKTIYEKSYKAKLESYIECDTGGYFQTLLVALLKCDRDESKKVDKFKAIADAKALYKAGEGKFGTDESTFITILTQRNYNQLRLIFDEYQTLTGHTLEYAIDGEFSGFTKSGLLAIVKGCRDLPKYYAECLHASMAKSGTNNKDFIRIIGARHEIDMHLIKTYYKYNYGITLEEAIAGKTSGDYKTLLLELVKHNPCLVEYQLGCPAVSGVVTD